MKNITKVIIGGLIIIAIAFYGGFKYGQSQRGSIGNQTDRFNRSGLMNQRSGRVGVGGGMIVGEILSKDTTSLTLKLREGGSRIILISSSTEVQKMDKGSLVDLSVGKSVVVNGSTNSDGSLSATSIQLRAFPLPH